MLQQNNSLPTEQELARFMAKVEINPETACWEWTGQKTGGRYGGMKWRGRQEKAHRLSFLFFIMPERMPPHVCHRCDNPPCVNPLHLFAGDLSSNMLDSVRKGRHYMASRKACKNGHVYEPETTAYTDYGARLCRICSRIKWRKYSAGRKARAVCGEVKS